MWLTSASLDRNRALAAWWSYLGVPLIRVLVQSGHWRLGCGSRLLGAQADAGEETLGLLGFSPFLYIFNNLNVSVVWNSLAVSKVTSRWWFTSVHSWFRDLTGSDSGFTSPLLPQLLKSRACGSRCEVRAEGSYPKIHGGFWTPHPHPTLCTQISSQRPAVCHVAWLSLYKHVGGIISGFYQVDLMLLLSSRVSQSWCYWDLGSDNPLLFGGWLMFEQVV